MITLCINNCPGTTWDYWEDSLTFPRLEALHRQWKKHPPVHHLVAGFFEYEAPDEGKSGQEAIEALMAMFPGGKS